MRRSGWYIGLGLLVTLPFWTSPAARGEDEASSDEGARRWVSALLGETPLEEDLQSLTDGIGGRPTGSEANERSVSWAMERFLEAGVEARRESFVVPLRWLERSASAEVRGAGGSFSPRIAAMPFSTDTPAEGRTAGLVDGGRGTEADFEALGDSARAAFVFIHTDELKDVPGLFKEYEDAAAIERLAVSAKVGGLVYMGSRPGNQLHRHNVSLGPANRLPMVVIERDAGLRIARLLGEGESLELTLRLDLVREKDFEVENVVGEIRGWQEPEEFVVVGAHLDSWGLGTGALDNGCNVALVLDLARQLRRLGIQPRRTIRFALFNAEEIGLLGSRAYTARHADELDRTVMASSYDIGSGRITGFFTGGRPDVVEAVERSLIPVAGLGPFQPVDVPIVGTDNFDFMMEGVPNLVANQASANYGPNYHARSDTFDKVDLEQLRLNAAIAAAVTWGFSNLDVDLPRHGRKEVQALVDRTDLGEQMQMFGMLEEWENGLRGRGDHAGAE